MSLPNGTSFPEIEKHTGIDEDHAGVISKHEPGRRPRDAVYEWRRKRPKKRCWEVTRRVRRDIAENMQEPRTQKPWRILCQPPKQNESDGPDEKTMGKVVGVEHIRRKYRQRRRPGNFPRQSESDPFRMHDMKNAER